ncbi:MAG: hypothetical protein RLZZ398_1413 [Verrucomicrobiota bacterium]|jgi:hypothetical protein
MTTLSDDTENDAYLTKLARRLHPSITPWERRAMEDQENPDEDYRFLTLPDEGSGHNSGLKRVADLLLNVFDLSNKDAEDYLKSIYHRDFSDVRRAVRRVRNGVKSGTPPKFPVADTSLISAVTTETRKTVSDLKEWSPGLLNTPAFKVIHLLMREAIAEDPLVCIGSSKNQFATKPLSTFKDHAHKHPYLVPQPMTSEQGKTKDGRLSSKSNANTSERSNLVVEFDKIADKDKQASLLLFLADYAPLLCVCDSGGKSLHGFYDVANRPHEDKERFMRIACRLGADRALWTLSQFARIPGGTRPAVPPDGDTPAKPAAHQTLLFLDPDAPGRHWRIDALEKWADSRLAKTESTDRMQMLHDATLSAASLCKMDIPKREKVLGEFFLEGDLGFIFAPRGLGKTWLGTGCAAAIASGGEIGEWRAARARRVLIIDGEMNLPASQERLRMLNCDSDRLLLLHHEIIFNATDGKVSLNLADPKQQQDVCALIKNMGVQVVVIDNLSCLFRGVAENEADAWEAVLPWLLDLRRAGISVVVIAHAGRNGQMRGTSRREDSAHWVLSLEPAHDESGDFNGTRFVSRFTKNRNSVGSESPPTLWEFRSGLDGMTVTAKPQTDLAVMLDLIRGGMDSASDLAKELDRSKGCVSKWAKRLNAEGKISITSGGKYKPA